MSKSLLIVVDQLYKGGAQKVAARLSIELSSRYNVHIVTYNKSEGMYQFAGNHIHIGLPYSENPSVNNVFARFTRFILLISRLRKIKRKYKIDVAISFLEASNIVNALSRRKEKVIVSVRAHLSKEFADDKRLQVFKTLIRVLYNRVYKVVSPSEGIKEDLTVNFSVRPDKILVIYNFINKPEITSQASEPFTDAIEHVAFKQSPVLVNVGRLTNPKGQWFLPPILKKVKEKLPGAKLVILGDGLLKPQILQAAQESGLSLFDGTGKTGTIQDTHDIYLLGFKNNPFPYLRKSGIFVFTSIYEGFPNVLLEAMTCGLPVISSDCLAGPREILAPGTNAKKIEAPEWAEYGVLIPVMNDQDPDLDKFISLSADAIVKMWSEEKIRNSYIEKSAIRSDHFNRDQVIGNWISLIEE